MTCAFNPSSQRSGMTGGIQPQCDIVAVPARWEAGPCTKPRFRVLGFWF